KQASTYAEVVSVKIFNTLSQNELAETASNFLKENNLTVEAIDAIVLGNNGDVEFDRFYNELSSKLFSNTQQVCYKHLIGEFNTASPFGIRSEERRVGKELRGWCLLYDHNQE